MDLKMRREQLPARSPQPLWKRRRARVAVIAVLLLVILLPLLAELLEVPDVLSVSMLRRSGIAAPFILLAGEEAGVPLPIPGDILIAYVGYRASTGVVSFPVAFGALLAAVLVGSSFLYYVSSRWGVMLVERLGRYLHVSEERLASAERRFQAHGAWFIIIGRHIPGLRIPITIFCGVSGVRYPLFLASTVVSVVFWIAFWLIVGTRLGRKTVHLLQGARWYTVLIPLGIVLGAVLVVRIVTRVRARPGPPAAP